MSDFSCNVFKVPALQKHDNADTLSIVEFEGQPCIVRTTDYKEGDIAVYIPVEALIPEGKEWVKKHCSHLKFKNGVHRLKAVRLRGVFSMGMVVPYDAVDMVLKESGDLNLFWGNPESNISKDVAEKLGIIKYEEQEDIVHTPKEKKPKTLWGKIKWFFKKLFRIKHKTVPRVMPVYEVDHYRKLKDVLVPGEEVIITEKIHGCVGPGAKIVMADGTYRRMKDIQIGEYVLGCDKNNNTVSSKVLEIHDNGKTSEWLNIKTESKNAGKGPSYRTFECTPNHEVFTQRGYVAASDLKKDDKLYSVNTDQELDPIQEDILIGKMLGDASRSDEGRSIAWTHKAEHKEYIEWTKDCLSGVAHPTFKEAVSGYGTEMLRARTISCDRIKTIADKFYNGEKKVIPKTIKLSPISLAFWYMDDGSLSHHESQKDRAHFAVCSFTEKECEYLQGALYNLDINAAIYTDSEGYNRIRLNADDAERLFILIAPYIPKCMQYKLPERFRGHEPWFPKIEYKEPIVAQEIISIQVKNRENSRRDLTTETHNYFVGGVLVHNSNAAYCWHNDRFYVSSHHVVRGVEDNSAYWRAARQYDLENKLKAYPELAFFGEIYGPSIQDMGYGLKNDEIKIAFFDVMHIKDRKYLNHAEAKALLDSIGLPRVPAIYAGPYLPEVVEPLVEGASLMPDCPHPKEGWVVSPKEERISHKCGRIKLKAISEWYLLRKGGSEKH